MDPQEFIDGFVSAWLANYVSSRYQDMCDKGDFSELENLPTEDAYHIAQKALRQYQDMLLANAGRCKIHGDRSFDD
jgi:hypothetical protein